MKNYDINNWDVLVKYLAGEADEQEQKKVLEWVQASPSNSAAYNELKTYWDYINNIKTMNQFDIDDGWKKLHNRIIASSGSSPTVKELKPKNTILIFGRPLLKIAATVGLLVMLGTGIYWTISTLQKNERLTVASSGADDQTRITLPDGSVILLNADTKISYTKNFNTLNREVMLTGEAYFDVTHDPQKPFMVYTGEAVIKVLGTSFNVQSLKSSGKVEVFVESGSVQLSEADNINNTITIEPGFIGSIENESLEMQKNTDQNYLAWKTRKLVFDNIELEKVAADIQDVFKVKVVFENQDMTRCKIRSNFEDEPLENVLEAICTIHNWKWERKGDKIILSGPGC
ncbi:MAG: FecR domain-containing protein [Bacteroidales bacterium]|nr:FecR domain-containing protein [Bacteroidales bacterium]